VYRKVEQAPSSAEDFELSNGCKLAAENRWVILAQLIPERQPTRKQKRKAIKKQLQYLKRNLSHIAQLIELGASLNNLRKRQYKTLLVVSEVYRQQLW
jgi:hypothetical protein